MEAKTTCIQCHTRMNSTANFCENCGVKISTINKREKLSDGREILDERSTTSSPNGISQNLIFTGLIILCASTFYYFILGVIVDLSGEWRIYDTLEPLSLIVSISSASVALLIAFGMRSGNRKTVAIILASISTLIHLYWFIDRLIPDDPGFELLNF